MSTIAKTDAEKAEELKKTTDTPAPVEKTAEDKSAISKFAQEFIARPKKEEKKEEKKDEKAEAAKDKKTEPDDKAGDEKGKKEEPKEEKPKAKAKAPAPSQADMMESAVAKGIEAGVKAARASDKPAPEEKRDDKPDDFAQSLPDEDKETLTILSEMEKASPSKYKGISKKYTDSLKAANKYADEWERKNPGKTFDDNDDEHTDYLESINVDWDDKDYIRSAASIEAKKLVAEELKPVKEKLNDFEKREKIQEAEPKIHGEMHAASKEFWAGVDDSFKGVVDKDGKINREAITKASEADPVAFDIATHYEQAVIQPIAAELYKLGEGLVDFNPKILAHQHINEFALAQEAKFSALPKSERLDDKGRDFVASDEYAKMSPAEQKRYWTINTQQLTKLWVTEKTAEAAGFIKQEREKVKRYAGAYSKGGGTTQLKETPSKETKTTEEEHETPDADDRKPDSPSTSGSPKLAGKIDTSKKVQPEAVKSFMGNY